MAHRFALVTSGYSIGNSSPLLNLLRCLATEGGVTVYAENMARWAGLEQDGLSLIHLDEGDSRWRADGRSHEKIIAVDTHGVLLARQLFPDRPMIYYSLELDLPSEASGEALSRCQQVRQSRPWISGLLIQSEERARCFLAEYGFPNPDRIFLLPVTGIGAAMSAKSEYLRRRYRVPATRRLVLHCGGIEAWYNVAAVAEQFSSMTGYAFFMQGHAPHQYAVDFISSLAHRGVEQVIRSEEYVMRIEDLSRVFSSCEFGIAWYCDISANFRTAGESSAKIAQYLQYGLPVVANRQPSTERSIRDTGCGVVVDAVEEIEAALDEIAGNYAAFSRRALDEFESRYRFDRYREGLLQFLCWEG